VVGYELISHLVSVTGYEARHVPVVAHNLLAHIFVAGYEARHLASPFLAGYEPRHAGQVMNHDTLAHNLLAHIPLRGRL